MTHYAVTALCPTGEIAVEYLEWLTFGGHLRAVLDAGAVSATAVRLDPAPHAAVPPVRIMSVYRFASREAFAAYERDHAPRLRAEGLEKFGDRGLTFVRETGEIIASEAADPG